ncbi:molecular chaperone [Xenorhabdus sp. KJ12.1]|uniref:fimbrial biogenesis chaperone n=1 Tax=Xenorhabdus sp. KJ12.1 TaxID=1851571 RepID=UPI000C0540CB|nr:molecular chaperone [Xenorhabdus sp. KJ12.1]PHM72023.1 putative chaperone protein EcpD [Xenorhabdus sp. KJ12.1]
MTLTRLFSAITLFLVMSISSTYASIQINTTRVIYHAAKKDVSVQVNNSGKYPVLLQSWTDDGHPEIKPDVMRTPFVLTPPLTRVNADTGQTLRLSFIGPALPSNRESVYWLNVLEIPPVDNKDKNLMQVAFRTRIKLFYRPKELDDKGAQEAASQLHWHPQGNKITLTNPSPYYVSAVGITATHAGKKSLVQADMIPPRSNADFSLPAGIIANSIDSVTVDAINDYGAVVTVPVARQ